MPANLHTHLGCLSYNTTPSYTITYLPLWTNWTLSFVLSCLIHLPPLPQIVLIAAPFFSPVFFSSLLPQQHAAEHSEGHHSTGSVSEENTCKKALLCFNLRVPHSSPVRRCARNGAHPLETLFLQFNYWLLQKDSTVHIFGKAFFWYRAQACHSFSVRRGSLTCSPENSPHIELL